MSTCIVLAGGVGSRLYPLTRVVPKPMVPFAGLPLIEYIITSIREHGFRDIVISARYLGEQLLKYFENRRDVVVLLLDSKDTADAVRLISEVYPVRGDFIVSMGDVVTNIDYRVFYRYHVESGGVGTIVLKEVDNPLPYGLVYVDEDNDIILFTEKPPSLEIYLLSVAYQKIKSPCYYSNLVNAGIYAFKDTLLKILNKYKGLMDFGRHVFPHLLETGHSLKAWIAPHDSYWNDIGRISIYKEALWDLIENRVKGWSPRGRQISRNIYVAEGVEIHGSIYPPVYLGRDVIVERGAVIGPYAVLEDGVVVGKGARITHSIIWHKSIIGENTYVYDSVLMNNVKIGNGVKVISSTIGTGCVLNQDQYEATIEPCITVSPYEDLG